ncbi:ABC transporter substrate-binding protein, partial [Petrotoga halophila DSM 16923]
MLKYIVRRLILAIPVLLGVSVISFFVMQLAPGDFLDTYRINPNISREKIQELETLYGLDKNPVTQYFIWLGNILKGDWGYSFVYKIGVWEVMIRRLEATLLLGVT